MSTDVYHPSRSRAVLPIVVGLALATGCASSRPAPPAAPEPPQPTSAEDVLVEGNDVAEPVLRDAVEERVGVPENGPAQVEKTWTWRPRPGTSYVVWSTCRGEGDTRACALSVGVASVGKVDVRAHAATAWSIPEVAVDGGPGTLRLAGDDDRGKWRQTLEARGDGTVTFGPRTHSE